MYTTELLARQGDKGISDKITVRNLQVTVNAGADAWGRKKIQPALLTVTLFLSEPFDTAAQADSLDDSTVHYGILSKSIKSQVESNTEHRPTPKLAWEIYSCVDKTAGRTLLRAVEVEIFYPKASLLGDGAGHKLSLIFRGEDRTVYDSSELFYLRNVRIPCVIGVNANERLQKQPVVVNLWMENMGDPWSDECTNVEGCLTDEISTSSFETLESLSTKVVSELMKRVRFPGQSDSQIRLRVEKPMAVPFADAPCIEIVRRWLA